ncbi:MAG: hypothetical protein Tsb0017_05170 [Geothermobacteraceae bacterium]
MLNRLIDLLASVRLTLILLFGLALVSIFGTLRPSRDAELEVLRYELFYQSPGFRLLLALLAVNLLVCSLRLLRRRLGETDRLLASEVAGAGAELEAANEAAVLTRLRDLGFRSCQQGERMVFWRRRWARFAALVMHGALLLIMAGALASHFGFVATVNVYEGDHTTVAFDWDRKADRELGFTLQVDRAQLIFYPIDLKVGAIDPATGGVVKEWQVRVGDVFDLERGGYSVRVDAFDPLDKVLSLTLLRAGREQRKLSSRAGVKDLSGLVEGVVLYPLAFRDPVLKQYRSEVRLLEQGEVVRQGVIEVNRPLVHRGVAIYQTAWNRDDRGRPYAGFQLSRDPGEPLVWGGCVLFMFAFFAHLLGRPEALLLDRRSGRAVLYPSIGFGGHRRSNWQHLLEELGQSEPS